MIHPTKDTAVLCFHAAILDEREMSMAAALPFASSTGPALRVPMSASCSFLLFAQRSYFYSVVLEDVHSYVVVQYCLYDIAF